MPRRSKTEKIINALTRLVEKIKCRLICCYSSCNERGESPPSTPQIK